MGKQQHGFVYILTNPSFKDDWVKIGKTERTVEDRVKELDTTAVPLPFQIYASLQTSKWNEAEKSVHKLLNKDRIRYNREFFNIDPEKALEIFKIVVGLLDDAIITLYNENGEIESTTKYGPDTSNEGEKSESESKDGKKSKPKQSKQSTTGSVPSGNEQNHLFSISRPNKCSATGYYDEEKDLFILLKGSIISKKPTASFSSMKTRAKVLEICEEINNGYRLKKDYMFASPSTAACVVLGCSENGNRVWKDKNNKRLSEIYPKEKQQKKQ